MVQSWQRLSYFDKGKRLILRGVHLVIELHKLTIVIQFLMVLTLLLSGLPVIAGDDIPWSFETDSRVIAIGDLHGDLDSLKQILLENKVIDRQGKWISGADHLVLNGDLVNLGPKSFELLNFVMDLEKQASMAGGKVHAILGNHEVMLATGKFNLLSPQDKKAFADFAAPGLPYSSENLFAALTGNSIYAKWFRSRNSIIRINRQIFVHAGLDTWILNSDPGQINYLVREWLKRSQMTLSPQPMGRLDPPPPPETKKLIEPGSGPSGTTALNDEKNERGYPKPFLSVEVLDLILRQLNADSIAVGHIQTHDQRISMLHSRYGSRVIQLDTGISEAEKGRLSALIMKGSNLKSWHQDRKLISEMKSCTTAVKAQ
jgi:3',5'-cyclic AMP phosphodiesterase CpdA